LKKNNIRIYIKLFLDRIGLLRVVQKINNWKKGNSNQNNDFNVNGIKVFELLVKKLIKHCLQNKINFVF